MKFTNHFYLLSREEFYRGLFPVCSARARSLRAEFSELSDNSKFSDYLDYSEFIFSRSRNNQKILNCLKILKIRNCQNILNCQKIQLIKKQSEKILSENSELSEYLKYFPCKNRAKYNYAKLCIFIQQENNKNKTRKYLSYHLFCGIIISTDEVREKLTQKKIKKK
jgi:hypothetical protein